MSTGAGIGSVVVPAHNEQRSIAACLAPIASAAAEGTLELVVVCNGCTDETAEIARSFPGVRVVELPVGSKPAALRAGDGCVEALPRLYLDADVELPLESALAVLRRLRDGAVAARPPIRYDASGASWLVRRYYRARGRIPAVLGSLWGAGVYGLSAAGRGRFGEFPDLVSDDLWVDQLFSEHEVEIVECAPVTVTTPRSARDLLTVLSRVYRGKAEHHETNPVIARETSSRTATDVARLLRSGPAGGLDAIVYTGFAVAARALVRVRHGLGRMTASRRGRQPRWERDESSRAGGRFRGPPR